MSTPSPTPSNVPARRRKRRYVPLIVLLVFIAVAVGLYVRGEWADKDDRNPANSSEGAIVQLYRQPDGNVVVRSSAVVDATPAQVWAVISDYKSHGNFLPNLSKLEAKTLPDGRTHLDGVAHSRIWGDWPFASDVTHREIPDKGEYAAAWDEKDNGSLAVNRGGWQVHSLAGGKQSLVAFTLQVELKNVPNFLVRNIVMDRLANVVKAMGDEVIRRKAA